MEYIMALDLCTEIGALYLNDILRTKPLKGFIEKAVLRRSP